jgi:N-acyl-L-homoserine lactone synthetase
MCETPDQLLASQELRYAVFCEEKRWVDPLDCSARLETDEYDSLALHFLALDGDTPIGTVRLLLGARQPLPAADYLDLDALGLDTREVAEVSRLAIQKTGRSSDLRVFLGLTRCIWEWGMDNSMAAWLAIADVSLFRLLERLGMPVLASADHIDYLGSRCVPVAFDLARTGEALKVSFVSG